MTANKYLVLISVSGIQSYIQQSISTKDLYTNSQTVIHIMEQCKDYMDNKYMNQCTWIIPNEMPNEIKDRDTNNRERPNYCLIEYKSSENDNRLEEHIREELRELINCPEDLELYVSVVAYNNQYDENEQYVNAYRGVYKRQSLMKSNRIWNWSSHTEKRLGEEQGRICLKCQKHVVRKRQGDDGDAEILCESCYREKKENDTNVVVRFPSVTEIAAWDCLKELAPEQKLSYLDIKKNNGDIGEFLLKQRAETYYAIFQADIDDFGNHMSGAMNQDRLELKEIQGILTRGIDSFNKNVMSDIRKIEELKGYTDDEVAPKLVIYMGGDDMLLFSPLESVISILGKLRDRQDEMNQWLKANNYTIPVTISVSVTLCHHKSDLRRAVKLSRQKLGEVKSEYEKNGKNGMIITLKQRSGAMYQTVLPFTKNHIERLSKSIPNTKVDKSITQRMSMSRLQSLEKSLRRLGTIYETVSGESRVNWIMHNEIKRLCQNENNKKAKGIEKDILIAWIECFKTYSGSYIMIDWDRYFSLFKIAEYLGKEKG